VAKEVRDVPIAALAARGKTMSPQLLRL